MVQTIQKCWNDFQINLTISSSSAGTNQNMIDSTATPNPQGVNNNHVDSTAAPNVSLTQTTGSGLTTESVAMTTTESVQEPNVTPTSTPSEISTDISPQLNSSSSPTGSGHLNNKTAQTASTLHETTTQSSFVTSTPSTSVGPLPVRDSNSSSRGRGPLRTESKIGSSNFSNGRGRVRSNTGFHQTTTRSSLALGQRPSVRSPVFSRQPPRTRARTNPNTGSSVTPPRNSVSRNQRPNNLPQEVRTDFSRTRQNQFQSRQFDNNFPIQNTFPQSVGAVNFGNQELVVFDLQDLIPFLGTDALSRFGLDTNNMINFNNGNRNTNNFNRRPTSFNPDTADLSSRFGNIPSRIVGRFPSGNRFDSERQTGRFVNNNAVNRAPFSNVFNRNEFNQPQTMRSSNTLTNQNDVQNSFNPRLSQSTNQFRFPQRRSRMIDLINSSSRIRAPTFNNNFF